MSHLGSEMELLRHLSDCRYSDGYIEPGRYALVYFDYLSIEGSIDSEYVTILKTYNQEIGRIRAKIYIVNISERINSETIKLNGDFPIFFPSHDKNSEVEEWIESLLAIIDSVNVIDETREDDRTDQPLFMYGELNSNNIDLSEKSKNKNYYNELIRHDLVIESAVSSVRLLLGLEGYPNTRWETTPIDSDLVIDDETYYRVRCELLFSMIIGMIPRPIELYYGRPLLYKNAVYMTRYMYDNGVRVSIDNTTKYNWFKNEDPAKFIGDFPCWKDTTLTFKIMYLSNRIRTFIITNSTNKSKYIAIYAINSILRLLGFSY